MPELPSQAAQRRSVEKFQELRAKGGQISVPTAFDWQPTVELRRYDNTDKLTDCRLQQRWSRTNRETHQREFEWRDVPIVWEKPVEGEHPANPYD